MGTAHCVESNSEKMGILGVYQPDLKVQQYKVIFSKSKQGRCPEGSSKFPAAHIQSNSAGVKIDFIDYQTGGINAGLGTKIPYYNLPQEIQDFLVVHLIKK